MALRQRKRPELRHISRDILGWHGAGQKEALGQVALGANKRRELFEFLNAFGDHLQAERPSEFNQSVDDRRGLIALGVQRIDCLLYTSPSPRD